MWWSQEDAAEDRQRVEREINRRRERGEPFEPLSLEGVPARGKLTRAFWGKAWCDHLEAHAHYEHRLPRGRAYLRRGSVYDFEISPGRLSAHVTGAEIYETEILIEPVPAARWRELTARCAGQAESMLDLLAGKLGAETIRLLCDPETGLLPREGEMRARCTCPDHADLCKHAAALLYAAGVKLDADPASLFVLRGVELADLIHQAGGEAVRQAVAAPEQCSLPDDTDLSALFGIELAEPRGDGPTRA
jgi:uncharacterized Zn finger protein